MVRPGSATLGQLWLLRDGASLRARRMMPVGTSWPPQPQHEQELSDEQREVLAEYHWLDEQVRLQRHHLRSLAGVQQS